MNFVSGAMRRPITVLVVILATAIGALFAWERMPRDIFPDLGVPVIYVSQPYGGMDPAQMESYLVSYYEYHFLYVTGIEHIESKSIQGAALIKLQFHPGTNMAEAMAEVVAEVDRSRAFMPPGTVPPFIMRFDAGSVPVGNLVFSSTTKTVAQMQDLALFRVRPMFSALPGVSAPPPFGASQRTVVIHVDPDRLRACGLSLEEVTIALSNSNLIMASGNVRIGDKMPMVPVNSVVREIKDLESVPIRTDSLRTIFLRDIGHAEDSSDIQTGYALVNGHRTVYIPVTKRSDASTLAVVDLVKANIPKFQAMLPDDIRVSYEFDQSPVVRRAIRGLVMESVLGAVLTGLMVLIFLRDWRSTFIVVVNIPLALLSALLALWISGQTVNIMTLGGLALAVGILVDEATVTVENIHTHLARGSTVNRAAFDASVETVLPRFLAMLCILAVFVPSIFMVGVARSLFVPVSLAVGFSMVASYILSSTLVPILSTWLLRGHSDVIHSEHDVDFVEKIRIRYERVLGRMLEHRGRVIGFYLVGTLAIVLAIGPVLGTEILPNVDVGQLQLRFRGPTGTRIEQTEQIALKILSVIKDEVGADNVELTLGYVGTQPPSFAISLIHLWTSGPEEGVLQIQLKREAKIGVEKLKERLRNRLHKEMPEVDLSFEPSDITSRVMSLGSPTPIQVAMSGSDLPANQAHAAKVKEALNKIPSIRDLQYGERTNYPAVKVNVDRERAGIMGLSMADAARSLVAATSSSRFVLPNFWCDPRNGVAYQVQIEIPIARMNSLEEIRNTPVGRRQGSETLLRNIASVSEATMIGQYSRYNMQRTVTMTANVYGEDLGRAAKQVERAVASVPPPAKVSVAVRWQIEAMDQLLGGLRTGLLLSVVVIFLLLAANFQSFRLALIVVSTIPAVMAGVVIVMFISGTTLNLQSLMGATMASGVAVANAILLVTFAERDRKAGTASHDAALRGGQSRLRPILMTSMAMLAGMVPMALALGEGGEQTAPLGRAVIGGLAASTLATLLVLPCVFAAVQRRATVQSASLDPDDPESAAYRGAEKAAAGQ